MDTLRDLLIATPVQYNEVFSQAIVQWSVTTTVCGADVACVCDIIPVTLASLPHTSGGHVTSKQLSQIATGCRVVEVIDETDEILAGLGSIVPAPLPLQMLLQAHPEHLTSCELRRP